MSHRSLPGTHDGGVRQRGFRSCVHRGYPAPKSKKANPEELAQVLESVGAGDRSRTYDLRITNALLYQLSYTGIGARLTL